MQKPGVYMDNHATTRVDPRVADAMLPYFVRHYGNAGSVGHAFGWEAAEAVERARGQIAEAIGARDREILFTSGATESNNLAILGAAAARKSGGHVLSVKSEHPAVLGPLAHLANSGVEVTLLDVLPAPDPRAGWLPPQRVADSIRHDTFLVSVMMANNEIGVLHPIGQIGEICRRHGLLLHCDATQAVGKMPVDVRELQVDMLSFTAHKLYGPKGVGALFVRRGAPRVRLQPRVFGGGQERGLRSGTLPVPLIVGFAKAMELCLEEMPTERRRLAGLRDTLWNGLTQRISGVQLCGPALDQSDLRLPGNLNARFEGVDGEALLLNMGDLAVSSGAACTSTSPEPSHVLRALGLDDDAVKSSLRFGLGRFNTDDDVLFAIRRVVEAVEKLRPMSSV